MASSISVGTEGLKVSKKSGKTKRTATVGPGGASIGISRGPVEVKVNSDGSVEGKISAGPISIKGDSDGNIGIGIQTPAGGIEYNSDGSGSITAPLGIAKMEVEKKGCVYIKRTYLAGTLIDTEYQQIEDCKEDPPDPPDPNNPKHEPPKGKIEYPVPPPQAPFPIADPNALVIFVWAFQGMSYDDYTRFWGPGDARDYTERRYLSSFTPFSSSRIKANLEAGWDPNSVTTYGIPQTIGFMRNKRQHYPAIPANEYDISLNFWHRFIDDGTINQKYDSGGEYDQDVFSDPVLERARPGSAGTGLLVSSGKGIWGNILKEIEDHGGLLNDRQSGTYPNGSGSWMSAGWADPLAIIELEAGTVRVAPPPELPIEKPPPPPPIMSNCCKESKVDLARVEEALERLEQVIGTREILNDPQGYAVPNKMLIPGGEGYSFSKNYLNIFTWLFAAIDRYGFDGPIIVDIADVDKGKAGNQSLQMQVNSLSTAIQTLLSLAVENKGDQATRLNIQIRLAFMLTRLMRMMHKMYYLVVAILEGLGIPTIKKYIKNIPFEFNLNPEDLGFGKKAEQLDTMNEDELEAQLPKILDTKEMDLIVEQFKPNQLDLRGFLLKLINKK